MTPFHLPDVPAEREAIAPYNFVPLPERVVPAEQQAPVDQSQYHGDRFTGRIECTLTTESPLFVRCGLTPEQLAEGLEAKDRPDFFYTASPDTPVIPGSSLRGMLRSLVEIAAYGKIDRVTDRPRFFYRAVAAKKDDPLQAPYEAAIGKFGRNVRAGYLERDGDAWFIRPVKPLQRASFFKVKEWDKKKRRELIPRTFKYLRLNDSGYEPQYVECSFTVTRGERGSYVKPEHIGPPRQIKGGNEGWMVTSGNMLETGKDAPGVESPRTSHVVVLKATESTRLAIDPQAVEDYRAGRTEFQQKAPFDPDWGVLQPGRPVFYLDPGPAGVVQAFGHSPNFRLAYRFPASKRAATPWDFVPPDVLAEDVTDLAEAIFGFVGRQRRRGEGREQAVAGRIFVGDATPLPGQADPWFSEQPITPHVLGTPKPTTFQHYLVQPRSEKVGLKHFGHRPGEETEIRGHKLYWHKGGQPAIEMPADRPAKDTQTTTIRPVRQGVSFCFTLHVENLSQVELGALLWVLRLGGDPAYRLKLGMGKPLGMGAVRLEHTIVESRRYERYLNLFSGDTWATGETTLDSSKQDVAVAAFEAYVLEHSGEGERYIALRDTLRMRCLLALLSWPGPLPERTRYMEIERTQLPRLGSDPNEYSARRVLPLPTQVARMPLSEMHLVDLRLRAATLRPKRPEQALEPVETQPTPPPSPPGPQPVASEPISLPKQAGPSIPAVGEVFRGKITQMDASAAVIAVDGFTEAQAIALLSADDADLKRYKVGNAAWVEVTEQKTQRSGRVLLIVKPAPKPKEGPA